VVFASGVGGYVTVIITLPRLRKCGVIHTVEEWILRATTNLSRFLIIVRVVRVIYDLLRCAIHGFVIVVTKSFVVR
jgi:hypothetical protein